MSTAQCGVVVPLGFWMFIKQAASCLPATWVRLCGSSAFLRVEWADREQHSGSVHLLGSLECCTEPGRETQTACMGPSGNGTVHRQDSTGHLSGAPKGLQVFHSSLCLLLSVPFSGLTCHPRSPEACRHLAHADTEG